MAGEAIAEERTRLAEHLSMMLVKAVGGGKHAMSC